MGHDCEWRSVQQKRPIDEFYISGNFTRFSDKYWSIYKAHGHTPGTIMRQLKFAMKKLIDDGFVPVMRPGENMWTTNERVLFWIMTKLYDQCEEIEAIDPAARLYSDQCSDVFPYADEENGFASDGEELPIEVSLDD